MTRALEILGTFLFVLAVFGPLIALVCEVVRAYQKDFSHLASYLLLAGRRPSLLFSTIGLSAAVAFTCTVVGTLAASFFWRKNHGVYRYLKWALLVLISLPAYIHALTWMWVMSWTNAALAKSGLIGIPLYGWVDCFWVECMAYIPYSYGFSLVGFSVVERVLIDASRTMRGNLDTFLRVVIPQAAPAILSGAALVFFLSVADYSVPSLFSVAVYPLEIFAEFAASGDIPVTFALTVPLLAVSILILSLSQSIFRSAALHVTRKGNGVHPQLILPRWLGWIQVCAVVLLGLHVLVPFTVLSILIGSPHDFVISVAAASRELGFTALTAGIAAIVCLPLVYFPAYRIATSQKGGKLSWFLITIPLAVPAPVVGIGLLAVAGCTPFVNLYGTTAVTVWASLARFTVFAVILVAAGMRRTDRHLIDAVRVHQRSPAHGLFTGTLPMLLPYFLSAGFLTFILTVGELGATLLVAPPGRATLTMRIYNFLHYGASSDVAGLSLLMTIVSSLAFLGIVGLFSKRQSIKRLIARNYD